VRDALAGFGCDIAQGFLVSSPLPAAAFQGWWSKNAAGG
jgi:EAL domain-containing protein (putative c-di-GMP-specific phosphodiesterase class I)